MIGGTVSCNYFLVGFRFYADVVVFAICRDIDTKHEEAFNSQKSVFDCDLLERQATYDSQICMCVWF